MAKWQDKDCAYILSLLYDRVLKTNVAKNSIVTKHYYCSYFKKELLTEGSLMFLHLGTTNYLSCPMALSESPLLSYR